MGLVFIHEQVLWRWRLEEPPAQPRQGTSSPAGAALRVAGAHKAHGRSGAGRGVNAAFAGPRGTAQCAGTLALCSISKAKATSPRGVPGKPPL